MNILYDHSIFQLQRYGGISRYFYELATRINSDSVAQVNFFEGISINEYNLSENRDEFSIYKGYKVPSIKYTGLIIEKMNQIWFKNTISTIPNIDIYHPTYYRKGIDKVKSRFLVLTVYDMIHELFNSSKENNNFIEIKRSSINSADVIIAISENTKRDLIEIYDIEESKIEVVYLANSFVKKNNININTLESNYSLKMPYLLYVGVRGGYKNFSLLLETYISSFSEDFYLVCFGGNKFNYQEITTIQKKGLSDKVIHLEGSDDLLAALYSNAFCFIYPSLYEGFGIPPLEAMSMGCPVVASNSSSIPEVVGDAAILFDPTSKDSLSNAIQLLKSNDSKRTEFIKKGFEQNAKFTWEKTACNTLDIYKNLV